MLVVESVGESHFLVAFTQQNIRFLDVSHLESIGISIFAPYYG